MGGLSKSHMTSSQSSAGFLPQPFLDDLLAFLRLNEHELSKEALSREKKRLCEEHGVTKIPSDIELLTHLEGDNLRYAAPLLLTKPVRSGSGVSVIAVMTRPARCPHGRCTYCPGGPDSPFGDVPQSYTGHEPATMRGKRAAYDAYVQVFTRLEQYIVSGHDPQKVELIIMGGTFPAEEAGYQERFVRECFQALNDFSTAFYGPDGLLIDRFKEFFALPGSVKDEERVAQVRERIRGLKVSRTPSLAEAHLENEQAKLRCVGLTVETRPTHGRLAHGNELLRLGCTRVELGVQTLFDDVLAAVHRGHTVQESAAAMSDLRDLGFKLNVHLMLGLPGMTRDRDVEAARLLFSDPSFRPDMLKVYPCMVLPGTPLHEAYKAGTYRPLSTEEAAGLIAEIKGVVPRWCRIMRVQRDIPTKVTSAGVDRTNLRQLVKEKLQATGATCRCIRCREIGRRPIRKAILNVVGYEASGGEEFFISIDDPTQDAVIGFCRLRLPGRQLRPEFDLRTGIVRELHVYGKATGLGVVGVQGGAQHRGYGSQLLHIAERIARENGKRRLLIISGVGVREYYRKLGYTQEGPYMAKQL
jgi:elongator complex protein 3